METIVYTCITNGYDKLNEIATKHRAICFSDIPLETETWEIIPIVDSPKIFRRIKICPHLFLPPHDRNVWIDGNLLADDIDSLVEHKTGFWTMEHPDRWCLYQEAKRCIDVKKDSEELLLNQVKNYYYEGYPSSNGLITSSILIRDNTEQNKTFSELWWNEVNRFSIRDQVSFNFVAWKVGLKYNTFPYLQGLKKVDHIK